MSKERLTKREKCRLSHGEEIVICNPDEEDCNDSCMKLRPCKWYEKAMEKLKKYEDLEEQGLLLRLPCKVGDTVYTLNHLPSSNKTVIAEYENVDLFFLLLSVAENRFGKTVFLTQSEAEEKLRELEGEEKCQ